MPDLAPLAAVAKTLAGEWGLELGMPFSATRYSYVVPAGADAVLKRRPAEDDESEEEADALALWDGDGAVEGVACGGMGGDCGGGGGAL